MTIENAQDYIENNKVYHNINGNDYRIREIRPTSFYPSSVCQGRLQVKIKNGIIDKIVCVG